MIYVRLRKNSMINFYFFIKLKEIIDISYLGSISFYDYMNFCLYSYKFGFYNNTLKKFKKDGVYNTLPESGKLFSFFLAIRLDIFLRTQNNFGILEIGPGSGQFSFDVLNFLTKFGTPFSRYLLLECSDNLYKVQKNLFLNKGFSLKIFWVKCIPYGFSGVVISNEVFDAVPFFCFSIKNFFFYEKRVSYEKLHFNWILCEFSFFLNNLLLSFFKKKEKNFFFSEFCLYFSYFVIILLRNVKIGVFYFFDYGFYYENYINETLRCVYKKLNYNSPFVLPSLQDITAHVDFFVLSIFCFRSKLKVYPLLFLFKFFLIFNLEVFSNSFDVYNKLYMLLNNEVKLCFFPEKMGVLFKILFLYKT